MLKNLFSACECAVQAEWNVYIRVFVCKSFKSYLNYEMNVTLWYGLSSKLYEQSESCLVFFKIYVIKNLQRKSQQQSKPPETLGCRWLQNVFYLFISNGRQYFEANVVIIYINSVVLILYLIVWSGRDDITFKMSFFQINVNYSKRQ